jgi:two-component system, NtrC family, sensor kinase
MKKCYFGQRPDFRRDDQRGFGFFILAFSLVVLALWKMEAFLYALSGITAGFLAAHLVLKQEIIERKSANMGAKASVDNYRMLYNSLMDAFVSTDMNGCIKEFNEPFRAMLGYEWEEVISLTYKDITPDKWHAFEDGIVRDQIMIRGFSDVYEKEYRRKDGTIIPVELRTFLVKDAAGNPVNMWAIVRDITERKKKEELLKSSEQRFRAIYDNVNDGIIVVDPETKKYFSCNKIFSQMSGYSPEEIMNMEIVDLHPQEELPHVIEEFEKIVRQGMDQVSRHIPIKRKDGSVLDADVRSSFATFEGKTYVLGIFRDVTERNQYEKQLKQERDLAKRYLDLAGVMIINLDVEQKVSLINKKGCQILGYPEEQILGKRWSDNFLPPRLKEEVNRVFNDLMAGNVLPLENFENPVLTGSGEEKIIAWHNTLIKDASGRITVVLCSGEDITERKKIEEMLWESRERYRAITDNSALGVTLVDNDYKVIMMNSTLAGWFKRPVGDFEGKYCFREYEKREAVCPHCPGKRAMLSGKTEDVDIRNVFDDGTEIYVNIHAVPFLGKDGAIKGFFEIVTDITERTLMEQKLKNLLTFHQEAISGAGEGVVVYDSEFRYMVWNKFMEDLTGLKNESVIGKCAFDLFPHLKEQGMDKLLARALAGETVNWIDIRFRSELTGRSGWVSGTYSPHRDASGRIIGVIGLIRDTTSRKETEIALRESENNYRSLIDISQDFIILIGLDQKIISANQSAFKSFGYENKEEVIGRSIEDFVAPEDRGKIREDNLRILTQKTLHNAGYVALRKDGSRFFVEANASLVFNQKQEPAFIISIIRDITERKQTEEELENAFKQLQNTQDQLIQSSKMAALGQLAGGVAHELNNPLTGVLNNVQLIKMEAAVKSEFNLNDFKDLLDAVEESALRCKNIGKSLLEMAHVSSGDFRPLKLNDLVDKVLSVVCKEMNLENIFVQKELQADLAEIKGDPQLLQQVILVLISNAKWAVEKRWNSEKGANITIKTENNTDKKTVSLYVRDNGIGISPENIKRLFEPFFTTKDVGQGTGLGLALIYNIIKRHGGEVSVESSVGQGAVFKISLPYLT